MRNYTLQTKTHNVVATSSLKKESYPILLKLFATEVPLICSAISFHLDATTVEITTAHKIKVITAVIVDTKSTNKTHTEHARTIIVTTCTRPPLPGGWFKTVICINMRKMRSVEINTDLMRKRFFSITLSPKPDASA
jgi:NADH dehydrogenase FAD-containing subunit